MSDIVDTTEMYIKVIYELMEDDVVAMRARIVERLHHSGPTVSQTVARLERDGLLYIDLDRQLKLTDEGMKLARNIMTKHRYVERLLVDVLKYPWELAHEEACKWEHVIGDEVLEYLRNFLGKIDTDPYGNLIPITSEALKHGKSLVSIILDEEKEVEILRIGEPVQVHVDLLKQFLQNNILPNTKVNVSVQGEEYILSSEDSLQSLSISKTLARHIFVK